MTAAAAHGVTASTRTLGRPSGPMSLPSAGLVRADPLIRRRRPGAPSDTVPAIRSHAGAAGSGSRPDCGPDIGHPGCGRYRLDMPVDPLLVVRRHVDFLRVRSAICIDAR